MVEPLLSGIVLGLLPMAIGFGAYMIMPSTKNKTFNNIAEYIGYYTNWINPETNAVYNFGINDHKLTMGYFGKFGMHQGWLTLEGTFKLIDNKGETKDYESSAEYDNFVEFLESNL